jgi:predicted transcriptional regulator
MDALTPSLTTQQQAVLDVLTAYYEATGEPCSARYIGRKLKRSPNTIRRHLYILSSRALIVSVSGLVPNRSLRHAAPPAQNRRA